MKDLRKEILDEATEESQLKKLVFDIEDFGEDVDEIEKGLIEKGWLSYGDDKKDK
jgi:hypothetical protein